MSTSRASDVAILLGHALQCEECRTRVLDEPERVMVGRKLSAAQRERLASLSPEDFESAQTLANSMGISVAELFEGVDHPRARLRHL